MKITMIGHCTVLIETSGKKIITDPYFGSWGNLVYERLNPPAKTREELRGVDLVLLSHNHWDHNDSQYLRMLSGGTPIVTSKQTEWVVRLRGAKNTIGIAAWETRSFGEVEVTAVPASHMIPAIGFIIQGEGKQVYFSGDTYYHPFMEQIGRQFQLDVALMPVTTYRIPMTLDDKGAVQAVHALKPTMVIPIHLGIKPRLPALCTKQTPKSFVSKLREAGWNTQVVILREDQSWETREIEQ